ncbi:hypothetical protein ACEWAA_22455 [Vibrio parahaemolyticus]
MFKVQWFKVGGLRCSPLNAALAFTEDTLSFEAKLYSIIGVTLLGQFFIPIIVSPIIFCVALWYFTQDGIFYWADLHKHIGKALLVVIGSFAIAWFIGYIVLGQTGGYGGYKYDLL